MDVLLDLVPRLAKHAFEVGPTLRVQFATACELLGGVEAGERRLLRGSGQVERAARLPELGNELRRGDAVAHAHAGEAVDLRERPEHDYPAARLEELLDAVRVIRIVYVLEVRLVEHGQHVLWDALEVRGELGARVDGAGRVVGVADVDELRARRHRGQQCIEVVAMVPQRHAHGFRPKLQPVDDVAGERGPAAHDLVARVENRL